MKVRIIFSTMSQQLHFVLFPFMAQGHMIPMIDIARLLAQRGVSITIFTTPLNAERFRTVITRGVEAGLMIKVIELKFPASEVGLPEGCENFDLLPTRDLGINFYKGTKMLQPQVEQFMKELQPVASCIIGDMCLPWTANVAHKFNIPWTIFHGMSCFSLLCVHNLKNWNDFQNIKSDLEYFLVPGLPDRIELTKTQLAGMVESKTPGWIQFWNEIKEAEDKAYGIVINSFQELEQDYVKELSAAKGKIVWTIGPVSLCNKDESDKAERGNKADIDEHQCLKWLDSQGKNSVLFVCLGSQTRLPTAQMIELGLGLESCKRPFIWVIRHKSDEFKKWLVEENFEKRIEGSGLLIHGWAPQVLILSHPSIGAFLTHCGWNSTLEGISAGVPIITWPIFAEQFFNEKLVVNVLRTGVRSGVEVPVIFGEEEKVGIQVNRNDIKNVIDMVLGEGADVDSRREKATKLGQMAFSAVEEGGSSQLNLTKLIQDVTERNY